MLVDTLKIIKLTLNNQLSKTILRYGLTPCEDNGTSRMEHALEIFVGTSKPASKRCKAYSFIFGTLLKTGERVFNVSDNSLRRYLRDSITRRGLVSVLRGIARYGITKPQRLDAPFLVVWNFTNACNLNCKHCYQTAGKPTFDELRTEEKLRVVEELADAGVVGIAFSGGEPLMNRDFYDVAAKTKEAGMFVALASNGTLITEKVAKRLREVGVGYIEISLDAATQNRHDAFRGVPWAFNRTLRGIENCAKEGIFTCVANTATQTNLDEVSTLINLTERLGAKRFLAFNFIPVGRGEDVFHIDLTPEQRELLLETLVNKTISGETKIEILSTAPQYARVSLELFSGETVTPTHFYIGHAAGWLGVLAEFIGGCGAGRMYCALQPNGDITPCVFMPRLVVGSIRETPFLDIWRTSEIMKSLRDRSLLKGKCGSCEYKYICGGCRARALAYVNDLFAPDPGCLLTKERSISFRKEMPLLTS